MKKLLALPLLLAAQACAVYGITDDYGKLDKQQKAMVVSADFQNPQPDKIYKVTGPVLLQEVQNHEKVLVYEFTNGCSSDNCKPMWVYEKYAKDHGYKLFLVMNGFQSIEATLGQRNAFQSPLYVIDSKAYSTVYRAKYGRMFRRELSGSTAPEDNYGGLFFFENGKFVKQLNELPKS